MIGNNSNLNEKTGCYNFFHYIKNESSNLLSKKQRSDSK